MAPRVAVLHHPRSFFPPELFQQVGDAAELVWVLDAEAEQDQPAARLVERLGTVVRTGGLDLDAAARAIDDSGAEGIVSFVDDHLETAAALAERLGYRYHSPMVAEILSDKRLQREVLADAGVAGPRFWNLSSRPSEAELTSVAVQICFPAVLKPARGSGSRGIVLVASLAELTAATAEPGCGFVLEELLEDDPEHEPRFASYLSVESVVQAGAATHVALTGRFPLAEPFRETGNFIPAVLRADLLEPILEMVAVAVEALGIKDAVVHSEIKLTPDGPRMIEVNGRLGGRPPFVLERVTDINLFRTAVEIAAGVAYEPPTRLRPDGVSFWLMIQPPTFARRVASVDGVAEITTLEGIDTVDVRHPAGDDVDWREGTASAVMTIRGRVDSHALLAATIEHIRHKVTFSYDT